MKKLGALPCQMILSMINAGFIKKAKEKNVSPASLDVTVSSEVYRAERIFQPRFGEKIRELIKSARISQHDLNYPLEKGVTYIARLEETFELPNEIYGYCNPKSSTGRNDIHVRILADGVPRYDAVTPSGFKGELWVIINPKSYPVKISCGETLSQLRFFNHNTRFDEFDLQVALKNYQLVWDYSGKTPYGYDDLKIKDNDGSIILTLDLISQDVIGYRCYGSNRILDLSKINFYHWEDFFEPIKIKKKNECIYLRKGDFYILSTRESIRVPPGLACEMVPMDERSGEFRSHYAGFIDPGWGWGKNGEKKGRPITLELRPFEDIVIRDNQPIGKIRFERMAEIPDIIYDNKTTSNYKKQIGPRLSKHFIC